jgi:hypothetical protein
MSILYLERLTHRSPFAIFPPLHHGYFTAQSLGTLVAAT